MFGLFGLCSVARREIRRARLRFFVVCRHRRGHRYRVDGWHRHHQPLTPAAIDEPHATRERREGEEPDENECPRR